VSVVDAKHCVCAYSTCCCMWCSSVNKSRHPSALALHDRQRAHAIAAAMHDLLASIHGGQPAVSLQPLCSATHLQVGDTSNALIGLQDQELSMRGMRMWQVAWLSEHALQLLSDGFVCSVCHVGRCQHTLMRLL
jgi:hypothetical protein